MDCRSKLEFVPFAQGHWVFLANCHLSISWLPELEKIVERLQTAAVHNDFRLWLSSSPTGSFPISILQMSLKITSEPQKVTRMHGAPGKTASELCRVSKRI